MRSSAPNMGASAHSGGAAARQQRACGCTECGTPIMHGTIAGQHYLSLRVRTRRITQHFPARRVRDTAIRRTTYHRQREGKNVIAVMVMRPHRFVWTEWPPTPVMCDG